MCEIVIICHHSSSNAIIPVLDYTNTHKRSDFLFFAEKVIKAWNKLLVTSANEVAEVLWVVTSVCLLFGYMYLKQVLTNLNQIL